MLLEGHFALLEPLASGVHLLEFVASICDGDEVVWETLAIYELHVEESDG